MNPLTNMKNVIKLSEQELYTGNKTSWHDQYRDSAWVFIGGLPFDLTEGDIICIFSQYGEIVNINLIRDKDNGKSKGFCFVCYEDQRSTDLAVDNFNGIKILNRTIRVDHVSNYKVPKQGKKTDAETKKLYEEGCAPKAVPLSQPPVTSNKPAGIVIKSDPDDFRETLADCISSEIKLPRRLPIHVIKEEKISDDESGNKKVKKSKKHKKEKKNKSKKKSKKEDHSSSDGDSDLSKKKKAKKSKRKSETSDDSSSGEPESDRKRVKKEPVEPQRNDRFSRRPRSRSRDRDNFRNPSPRR